MKEENKNIETKASNADRVNGQVDALVMRQTKNKEFAEQVINLYMKYRGTLNKRDIKNHNLIITMFQNLRDKNTLSA